MVHKTVLKVDVSCEKCKQEVFSIVSGLEGVNKMEADTEKDTLTIIGDADPYAIITCLRKAGKKAQFISVGPPPPPEKPKEPEKKPDPCKCPCPVPCSCPYPYPYAYPCPYPYSYPSKGGGLVCEPIAVMTTNYQDPPPSFCSIM
ncbi:uncharacterized protein LOC141643600 [Silene latifolia]|uniref:uncharacterized protein LOC141643600 n=1 Tax=Silene latifolia TaxID=37657 RepID=UPI003D781F90